MKKLISKIAKSNTESKVTLGAFTILAVFALVMPSENIVINILTSALVCLSAFVYINEDIK